MELKSTWLDPSADVRRSRKTEQFRHDNDRIRPELRTCRPDRVQIRGIKVTKAALLFPVMMTLWVAASLLKSIPTAGNDLTLELGGAVAGASLGALAALATTVTRTGATAVAKAGAVAAVLWVAGIGARVGFSLWVGHGGAATIRGFSVAHHITGGPAWGTAFILMALT